MSTAPKPAYVVMTVTCSNPECGAKQAVHVRARTGFSQIGHQTIACVQCQRIFEVLVPDTIVDGPFPVES